MAITKRTRFEILRRDNHTCQYCGAKAPDVVLHIDHVEPTALGGSDKPDNLVTACKDCNGGKASIAPGSPLVEAVGAKAAAYALGMTDKMTRLRGGIEEADEYCAEFEEEWDGYRSGGEPIERPVDYELTLHRWFNLGVPMRMVSLAITGAMALRNPGLDCGRFRYMCGIIWRQIDDSGLDYSLTNDTVKVFTEREANAREVDAFEAGQKWARGPVND